MNSPDSLGSPRIAELAPVRRRQVSLRARDRHPLAATLHEPLNDGNGLVVVINSAYAVRRAFYAAYADFLAGQGFSVLSWDYRGIGDSQDTSWHDRDYRMQHWGERDLPAVIDWLGTRYRGQPLLAVGHSAGGQIVGLADNNQALAGLLGVASQMGYWRYFDRPYDLLALAWFWGVVPLRAQLGRWIPALRRGGFDVPSGVALQWSRWGRNPHYISDAAGRPLRQHFHAYRGWVRLLHIGDDQAFAPRRAVEALGAAYRNAQVEVVTRDPAAWGLSGIGHFGFFRHSMPRVAWQETANWLRAAAGAPETQAAQEQSS